MYFQVFKNIESKNNINIEMRQQPPPFSSVGKS